MYTRKRRWLAFNTDMEDDRGKRPCFANQSSKRIPLSSYISQINNILINYPHDLLYFLQSHCSELGQAVQCNTLNSEDVYTLVRGLIVAMEHSKSPEDVHVLLTEILQPTFIARDLLFFISQIDAVQLNGQINRKVIENTVILLHYLVSAAPKKTQQLLYLPVDLLYSKLQRPQDRSCQVSWITQKQLQDLKCMVDAGIPEKKNSVGNFLSLAVEDQIRKISVFPRPEDILTQPGCALHPNPKQGSHQSEKSYLDLHFHLLREDFIKPLRDGIAACFTVRTLFSGTHRRSKGLRLYNNVHIVKVGTMPTGVTYMVRFDSPFTSFVSSKRLMSGSLVCLISNDCDDILFGTVVSYDRKVLVEGSVWLHLKVDLQRLYKYFLKMRFTMVESPAFFEGYRHVLEGLQELDHRLLPFRRYIVDCETSIFSPYYLGNGKIQYDITTLKPNHSVVSDGPVADSVVLTKPDHILPNDSCSTTLQSSRQASSASCSMSPSVFSAPPKSILQRSPCKSSLLAHTSERQKYVHNALILAPESKMPTPQVQAREPPVQRTPPEPQAVMPQIQATVAQIQCTAPQVLFAAPQVQCTPLQVSPTAQCIQQGLQQEEQNTLCANLLAPSHSSNETKMDAEETAATSQMTNNVTLGLLGTEAVLADVPPLSKVVPDLSIESPRSGSSVNMCAADPFDPLIWSPERFPQLDESQLKAIEMALTREFVLIQGPPGTGKTFIGLKIVEILLRNDRYWNTQRSPLLVVCYTNHALDQFLEGILQFQTTGVVRIGGRSRNKNMEAYSLKNIRKNRLHQVLLPFQRRRFAQIMEPLRNLRMAIPDCSAILETLHRGILTKQELEPEIMADKLQCFTGLGQSGMLTWLQILPQKGKPNTNTAKRNNSIRDSSVFQHEGDERFLDDEDYDIGEEAKQQWVESKFAYIVPKQHSERDAEILSNLEADDIMTQEEVPSEYELWLLPMKDRWRLYRKWMYAYKNKLKEQLNCQIKKYAENTAEMMKLTVQENQLILKEALVIGMTTTDSKQTKDPAGPAIQHLAKDLDKDPNPMEPADHHLHHHSTPEKVQ